MEPAVSVPLADLRRRSLLQGKLESLRGRSVLLATKDQLATAVALVELDGVARRLVLCTPDLTAEQLAGVAATAQADAVLRGWKRRLWLPPSPNTAQRNVRRPESSAATVQRATEWILLTSGTTGMPKLVMHSFEASRRALPRQPPPVGPMVWSTFCDIRRYGDCIYLRAVLSGSPWCSSAGSDSTIFSRARNTWA